MKIPTQCSNCQKKFKIDDKFLYTYQECPNCKKTFLIEERCIPVATGSNLTADKNENVSMPAFMEVGNFKIQPHLQKRKKGDGMKEIRDVPSYWALRFCIIIVSTIGCLAILTGISITLKTVSNAQEATSKVEKIEKELKTIISEIEALTFEVDPEADKRELDRLQNRYAELSAEHIIQKQYSNSDGTIYLMGLSPIFFGIIVIAFAQVFSCIRDIALNSF